MTVDQAEAEHSIVRSVSSLVGSRPVILAGSRATGEAGRDSDYDVYVVLPMFAALRHLRDLRRASDELSASIGVSVTLNPLPSFRLSRPGHTLIVWKLRREGKVLAPATFQLSAPWKPTYHDDAITSYALSGLRYLTEAFEPHMLSEPTLSRATSARVRKALRHAVQIELLAGGQYEPLLADAIAALPKADAEQFRSLAASADQPDTWLAVRDRLIARVDLHAASRSRRFVTNAQYVALRTLRTRRPRLRPLISQQSVSDQLGRALVSLTRAAEPGGTVNDQRLREAVGSLPEPWDGGSLSWTNVRDRIDDRWADAHPLVGF